MLGLVEVTLINNRTSETVRASYTLRELLSHGGEDLLIENMIENLVCNCNQIGENYQTDCVCFEQWEDCTLVFDDE